jgi:hypothetical protein
MLSEEQGVPLFAPKFCQNGDVKDTLELRRMKSNPMLFEFFLVKKLLQFGTLLQKYR